MTRPNDPGLQPAAGAQYFYITVHVSEQSDRPYGGGRPAYTIVYRSKAGRLRTNLRLRICEDTLGPLAGIPDCRQRRAVPPPASGSEGDLEISTV